MKKSGTHAQQKSLYLDQYSLKTRREELSRQEQHPCCHKCKDKDSWSSAFCKRRHISMAALGVGGWWTFSLSWHDISWEFTLRPMSSPTTPQQRACPCVCGEPFRNLTELCCISHRIIFNSNTVFPPAFKPLWDVHKHVPASGSSHDITLCSEKSL